mmetsp:Transcript_11994/g.18524  ORF Transcript_11994/g.18524 Transcript_11994/m.18524 type:complete len:95 (-) Transcript_11994:181-465(-)
MSAPTIIHPVVSTAVDLLIAKKRKVGELTVQDIQLPAQFGANYDKKYEVIFTDCSMPFMDGYECTKLARELFRLARVSQLPRIIAVTGHVEPEY